MTTTVRQLESEIEQTRAELASTIDQLVYRAHPKTIASREVASIKAHFVHPDSGEPRTDNIVKAAGVAVGVVALFVVLRQLSK